MCGFVCRAMYKRGSRDTCFSSCNRPGACQTGRKSSLVCFRLKSSGGRRAWASPCMYPWCWSPASGQNVDKKVQTNRGVKQVLGHTWGKARKKLFQLANNLFKKFQAASTFYTSPHSHKVWAGGGTTKPSLSCSLSQGSVKTLPASSEQIAVGL